MLSTRREEAHWTQSENKAGSVVQSKGQSHAQAFKLEIKSPLLYLLEGVHCCRVGSEGEGKLQHVHLDGAEQGTGFLYNQVIVGLICVCVRRESTNRWDVSTR